MDQRIPLNVGGGVSFGKQEMHDIIMNCHNAELFVHIEKSPINSEDRFLQQ